MTVIKKIFSNRWLQAVLVTGLMFVMMLAFWGQAVFASDEAEIFVKGLQMARGQVLYEEVITQHMPLMYELAHLLAQASVHTLMGFRLSFYALMALLFGLTYLVYSKPFGKLICTMVPIFYFFLITGLDMGTCITGDQFQAIGTLILLYEMFLFYKRKTVSITSCCMLSLSILLQMGTAFVSIFAIFAAFLFVLSIEIPRAVRKKRSFGQEMAYLWKKYRGLILIVILPWLLWFLIYAIQGNLDDFINWAYVFNRKVYPAYTDGFGKSIVLSILQGVPNLLSYLIPTQLSLAKISYLIILLFALAYLAVFYASSRNVWATACLILFLITCYSRADQEFHGTAAAMTIAFFACRLLFARKSLFRKAVWRKPKIAVAACILGLLLSSSYRQMMPDILAFNPGQPLVLPPNSTADVLKRISDPGEEIGFAHADYLNMLNAGTFPFSDGSAGFPWYWQWTGEKEMADLQADMPRIFYYDPDYVVYGKTVIEYAPELVDFIEENYTVLEGVGGNSVYVRNDYVDQAWQRLEQTQ